MTEQKAERLSAPTDQPIAYGQAGRSFAAAAGSASGRLLYVHTYLPPDHEWRIFEALLIRSIYGEVQEMLMAIVDDGGAIHVIKERHHGDMNSAAYYVWPEELPVMIADIEADYERRHCWRLSYQDAQRLKCRTTS